MRHDHGDGDGDLDTRIAEMALETGAPVAFVDKVRALFERKGISLRRDASPYLVALREAFRREEHIRRTGGRGCEPVVHVRDDGASGANRWERHLTQLRDLRETLRRQSRRLAEGMQGPHGTKAKPPQTRRLDGLVLSPGSVELPFVPGPEDLQ
jgi:hypothetical protein